MGIFSNFFSKRKERRASVEEVKFNNLSDEKKEAIFNEILALKGGELEVAIEKRPYVFPYIIGNLKDANIAKLIDIATKKGVSVYDLVDKNTTISNTLVVNIAAKNQPDLILELDDMPSLQDLITSDTLIDVFTKNPEVIFSECKALKNRIKVKGRNRDGSEGTRTTTLKVQLQRAMNIYYRPEAYKGNTYDNFAKEIASKIVVSEFNKKAQGNKMTTRSTTAANEMLKRSPEKGKVVPAKVLRNWNNRVLYVIPNQAKKKVTAKAFDTNYSRYLNYMKGLLSNPALNSFDEKEKTRLAKRCVTICPELFFELAKIEGFKKIANKLTVQLSAYETFKERAQHNEMTELLYVIGEKQESKVLAKSKANSTRKANKAKGNKKVIKPKENIEEV